MRRTDAKRVALLGMLFALAMAFSFLEGLVTPLLGLPPGVKPGLANVVVMYALLFLGLRDALVLAVLKSGAVFLMQGASAACLSLAGGLCAVLVMALAHRLKATLLIQSSMGAISHNLAQLAVVGFIFTQSAYTVYYALVLLISGLVMGAVTAGTLKALLPAFKKISRN